MTYTALALVLTAALIHATWNLLVKKSRGGPVFVWLFATLSSTVLIPASVILLLVEQHELGWLAVAFIVGTALLHLAYFMALQRGYQSGDLSLVYPLARGLGPTLAMVGAIVFLGERPSWLAVAGLLLVVLGIGILTFRKKGEARHPSAGIFYGVLTGVLIGCYTVWDKHAVSSVNVPPLVLEAFTGLGISLMLAPHAVRNWAEVRLVWRDNRTEVIGVAVFAPLSYILVLTAMTFTPVSYVAPTREISILFAAILGARFLDEGQTVRRLIAASCMVAGVMALALG